MEKKSFFSVNLSQEAKTAADVCATALNRQRRLLACAFADGVFSLFDTAEFTLLQNFRFVVDPSKNK